MQHNSIISEADLQAAAEQINILLTSLKEMVECYGSDDGGGPIAIIERAKKAIHSVEGFR